MAQDDEPIDDLRAVGMTAAAAAARAVEVVIRDQQSRQTRQLDQQQRVPVQTSRDATRPSDDLGSRRDDRDRSDDTNRQSDGQVDNGDRATATAGVEADTARTPIAPDGDRSAETGGNAESDGYATVQARCRSP